MSEFNKIQSTKESLKKLLKGARGIEGIGISNDPNGKFYLVVSVTPRISEKNKTKIPSLLDGYRIEVIPVPRAVFQAM